MTKIRFVPGTWTKPDVEQCWAQKIDRPQLRKAIERHLGRRLQRLGVWNSHRVLGRRYRVPEPVFIAHLGEPRWAEYEVVRELDAPDKYLVQLLWLSTHPLPQGSTPGRWGRDSDQGRESGEESEESESF